jgi:hypothetical protein
MTLLMQKKFMWGLSEYFESKRASMNIVGGYKGALLLFVIH